MKFTGIASAGLALLGVVNAAALPASSSDEAVKRDSTVENLDNPAWWGKKRDSTTENLDNPAWWGKKRDSDVEDLDNPAWWGKKRGNEVEDLDNPAWWGKKRDTEDENPGSVFSPTGTPAAPTTTYFVPTLPTTPLPTPTPWSPPEVAA